jgi:hypothetical protein
MVFAMLTQLVSSPFALSVAASAAVEGIRAFQLPFLGSSEQFRYIPQNEGKRSLLYPIKFEGGRASIKLEGEPTEDAGADGVA